MEILIVTLQSIYGAFFLFAGVMHFLKPKFFYPFIPNFFPKKLSNLGAGLVEILVGIGIFIPNYTSYSALGILLLLFIFLPIHIWDVFREKPAIGSKKLALIRVPVQFILMYGAYFLYSST